jgi:hypothetical protein
MVRQAETLNIIDGAVKRVVRLGRTELWIDLLRTGLSKSE